MYPLNYVEPVFRPPSEWQSLIIQVTVGCSWNKCTFCTMYTDPQKRFRTKSIDEIDAELEAVANTGMPVRRIFLADGDAMALSTRRLTAILESIKKHFPQLQRVSSYCLPRNLAKKSVAELSELRQMGLTLMYVGCESGDNEVLSLVEKGETYDSSLSALLKIKQAGMKSSVMILNGLGGRELSEQHIKYSARLMNEAQPDYLSTLVVSFQFGDEATYGEKFQGRWVKMQQPELFKELYTLISQLDLQKTIFRSDHVSNSLVLKGVLGKDKKQFLRQIEAAMRTPELAGLRPEHKGAL
ncbi:MAG: radical SAM protein [Moraxellaceae bacterium]|nr:MAG: radical SAM protein [Moraxellaceae bacterium]